MAAIATPSSVFSSIFPSQKPETAPPEVAAARYDRAWTSATRFLKLRPGLASVPRDLSRSGDAENALQFLLSAKSTQSQLLQWYTSEITTHFRQHVLPKLQFWQEPIPLELARNALSTTTELLQNAQNVYLAIDTRDQDALSSRQFLYAFMGLVREEFHVLVLHSLPRQRLQNTLSSYLFDSMKDSLENSYSSNCTLSDDKCRCTVGFDLNALHSLQSVGLGDSQGERAFAHAVHRLLQGPAIERRCFQVDWSGQRGTIQRLRVWISNQLVPALEQAVSTLSGNNSSKLPAQQFISAAVNSFGRMRSHSLFDYVSMYPSSGGALQDIKDYLSANGSAEKAHLCSSFTEQMQRRLFHAGASTKEILGMYINVINTFRLLDSRGVLLEKVAIPVRSYLRSREDTVSTIAVSFLANSDQQEDSNDSEKVCWDISEAVATSAIDAQDDRMVNWNDMEWVPDPIDAGPNYKASKSDDVVAYILALFEPEDFIKAFSHALGQHLLETKDTDLVRETKVIELLKSRLDSARLQQAEVMLKDMRESAHMNRRLNPHSKARTNKPPPTPREIAAAIPEDGITLTSLYEPFKNRMDSRPFQAAVALVAKRRDDLYFPKRTRLPAEKSGLTPQKKPDPIHFEARVLSSYFWPVLRDDQFRVPLRIQKHRRAYEQAFAATSGQRRIVWKPALDTMNITLDFEDRSIHEENIEAWKMSLLDAFSNERDEEDGDQPAKYDDDDGIGVDDLVDALNMPEDYVQGGISYWLGRKVLYEKSAGKYAVLDRLDMDVSMVEEPSQLDVNVESGGLMSEQAMLRQMAPTFQTFILEMLRNQGTKEVGGMFGITNMMKMVLPTFTYGDDEVKWLLGDMEGRGEVMQKGEAWAVAK
ncbi:Anaphase-promoting complex subunit 2 [Pseudocercospora fuligena]|uniref:Anaphase-promoting complex subunit 2 n=1 Tax=Pseudocercospora fuligena TaxID=685502 RepID=A0A8H6RVU9_9PEZI|nr:Anaphase-promoting complex subunit 2 [Pseudocercospora fuligena]